MLNWLAMAVQATAGPVVPIDERLRAVPACPAASSEVVVCGRRDQPYRLERLPDRYAKPDLPKAEARVGPGKLDVEGESVTIGGVPGNRVMVRLKLPF